MKNQIKTIKYILFPILFIFVDLVPSMAQIECWDPAMRTRDSKLSLQLYGGSDYMIPSLSAGPTAEPGYLTTRENSVTSLPGFKIGGLLKYNITDRFFVKAGIEYNQLRERFDFVEEVTEMRPGEVVVMSTTYRLYNDYKTMGLPVLLGYSLVHKPSFELNLEAGILANLQFDFDGAILNVDGSYQEDGSSFYQNSIGISSITNIEFLFKLKEKFGIFLNVGGKYTFNEINASTNPIDQKLLLIGSSAGFQFKL